VFLDLFAFELDQPIVFFVDHHELDAFTLEQFAAFLFEIVKDLEEIGVDCI